MVDTPSTSPGTPEEQKTQAPQMPAIPKIPAMPSILKKAENQPPVTSEEKLWGLASYIPLVGLIALVVKPESAYVRLHGRQGLLLFGIFFFTIFIYLLPFIGPLVGAIVHLGVMVLGAFSMYQAFIGNWWKIPAIGDIAEQIPVDAFTKVTREAVMGPGMTDANIPPEQISTSSEESMVQPPAEPSAPSEQQSVPPSVNEPVVSPPQQENPPVQAPPASGENEKPQG